jgi:hypothetical protein
MTGTGRSCGTTGPTPRSVSSLWAYGPRAARVCQVCLISQRGCASADPLGLFMHCAAGLLRRPWHPPILQPPVMPVITIC